MRDPDAGGIIDPRTLPVRFSRLRHFARSPLHYWHRCQETDDDTLARRLGRGAHALVLGEPVAVWDQVTDGGRARPRNGSEWEAFKLAHAGAEILNAKEYAQASAIAVAIERHPIAAEMIYGPNTDLELAIEWTHPLGRACSSRLDVYRKGSFVADLKTARDASIDRFGRTALWSHYHAQLSFYVAAVESLGHPTPDAFLIAVESEAPYAVTVLKLTPRAIEAGRRQCHLWFEQLLACEAANAWPGYCESIVDLDVPDDMGQYEILVSDDSL